jgi:hypothetical protein
MPKRQPPPAELDKAVLQAESGYICDPERHPVEYWHQEYIERWGRPLDWTRRYSVDNRWKERRMAYWRGVQAAWLRQEQMALISARRAELMDALELRSQLYSMIKPKMVGDTLIFPIQPKSYEGLVRTFIQLDDMVEGKRDAVMQQVDPMLGRAEAEMLADEQRPQLPFTGTEMRHMAHNLLTARREKRRAEMMIEDGTETDDPGSVEGEGGVEGEVGSGRHERASELNR